MLPNKRVETPRQVESPAKMEGSSASPSLFCRSKMRLVIEEAKKDLPKTGDPLYDAFFNLPEIDIPLTEDEARMQEKIRALCKEMEANK